MTAPVKHHLTLSSGGGGTWATCSCGWASGTWRTVVAAHLSFGRHLVRAS